MSEGRERREEARVPAYAIVEYHSESLTAETILFDISASGALLHCEAVDPIGTRGQLIFRGHASQKETRLDCVVRKVQRDPSPGMHVEFIDLRPELSTWLHFYCAAVSLRKRVVMVDDDAEHLHMMERLFTAAEFQFVGLRHPIDAAKLISNFKPHAVILDLMMPGMDGVQVAEALQAKRQTDGIPVIFYTATEQSMARERIPDTYPIVPKGVRPSELIKTVKSILNVT